MTGYSLATPAQYVLSFTPSGQLSSDLDPTGRGLTFAYRLGAAVIGHRRRRPPATLTYTGSRLMGVALPNGTSITYGYAGGLRRPCSPPTGPPAPKPPTPTAPPGCSRPSSARTAERSCGTPTTQPRPGHQISRWHRGGDCVLLHDRERPGRDRHHRPGRRGLDRRVRRRPPAADDRPAGGDHGIRARRTGQPVQITDPRGGVTTLSYDDSGNLVSLTDPLARQQASTYCARNNLLTYTDGKATSRRSPTTRRARSPP